MAVHIKLIKNNIKSSSSYGKYFAKTVSQGEVTLEEIAAEACRNSGFSEGSVIGVVTELQNLLKQKLSDGQTVVLDGIGRFSLRVESIGVDDPKAFCIRRYATCHQRIPHALRLIDSVKAVLVTTNQYLIYLPCLIQLLCRIDAIDEELVHNSPYSRLWSRSQ